MGREQIAKHARLLAGTAAVKLHDYSRTAQREAARAVERGNKVREVLQRMAARDYKINLDLQDEVESFNERAVDLLANPGALMPPTEEDRMEVYSQRGTLQFTIMNARRELRRNAGIRSVLHAPRFYTQYVLGQLGENVEEAAITYAQSNQERQESIPLLHILEKE